MWAKAANSSAQVKIATVLLTLIPLYYFSYRLISRSNKSHPTTKASKILNRTKWQQQWLETDLLQPWDPLPIQMKCNETKWISNLVFDLVNANGGVGNIRAEILDFLFYAIESGASIILPSMAIRRDDDLSKVVGAEEADFSYMFDELWFLEAMRKACPQMRIYESAEELGDGWKKEEQTYDPRVPWSRKDLSQGQWKQQTADWLAGRKITADVSAVVAIEHTMWETNCRGERPAFRRALGMVLHVRPDVRRYAAIAMFNMAATERLDLLPTDRIHRKAFYGAHLRTEADTIAAGWLWPPSDAEIGLDFTLQTSYYMQAAVTHGLSIIFAASGNASEVERFKQVAAANRPPLTVLSKWDLLSEAEGDALQAMHWDQQALVDLEILKRCSVFGGVAKSSFSFLIAVARTTYMEEEDEAIQDPWSARHRDKMVAFENKLNKIWGRNQLNEERIPKGAWP
ncbi:hypothetical protein CB0940_04977 [Cercospora beticola]|uniref:Alternative oxidase n=1 Tax=Cercospora beticola TaxID=122368 RepID=A0A2G5HJ79_CERBT|nr:hypothetical protein CB0940_04977 [Cercospora beticola]PIA92598.1 hypothetical protein CB0940_04977 [Cercospora beticola]WPB02265.1 hypothetical protein RHO25_006899 [Cercospora beticola]CAK1362868.1 unnamed protein product [Cercospora beticola]